MPFFYISRSHSQDTVERFWFNLTGSHHDVMTLRHDTNKRILPISACRCARKMILFCFYDTLGCWVQTCCRFCICMMTSRHDVMPWRQKHAVHISACRIDRKIIIIFCFYSFSACLFQKQMLSILCLPDVNTSWRNVMTPRNSLLLYQRVDVLKWWYKFVSVDISIAEFQTIIVGCICMTSFCHNVTS